MLKDRAISLLITLKSLVKNMSGEIQKSELITAKACACWNTKAISL